MCFGGGPSYQPAQPQVNPAAHPLDQAFKEVTFASREATPAEGRPKAPAPETPKVPLRTVKTGLTFEGR